MILRFRRFLIEINADVEKMFRMILVDARHRKFQRILWRSDPSEPLEIYELKTITYGLRSSPYCAVRVLQQCARDNCGVIPDVSRAAAALKCVLTSFYVDDMLHSVDTKEEAIQLAKDTETVLRAGGFNLRKWNSNDAFVIAAMTGGGGSVR